MDTVKSDHGNVDTCVVTVVVTCPRSDCGTDGPCRDTVREAFTDPR